MPESAFCTWTWYTLPSGTLGQPAAAGWYTDLMVNLIVLRGAQTVGEPLSVQGGYFFPGGCLRLGRGSRPGGVSLGEMSAKM